MNFIRGFLGYYLYAEASWPRKKGDKAWLLSGFLASTPKGSTACKLRLYYHMLGKTIGSLNVYTRPCNGCALNNVFTKKGQVGNYWQRAEITLQSDYPFQVIPGTWW